MPIKIPNDLPARSILEKEHVFVMTEYRALHQDIRPLKLAILNLMPVKITTETQILRCLANTPLQVEIDWLQTKTHTSKNTPQEHLFSFYQTFDDVKHKRYDGMIITGAPVELLEFEEVEYWDELCAILDWTRTNVHSTLHICWGAQAALYHHYGVPKFLRKDGEKLLGVFPHHALNAKSRLLRGFDEEYFVPHSRYTETRAEDILKVPDLRILSYSADAGVHIVSDRDSTQFFITGHSEYDTMTIRDEYQRDFAAGTPTGLPQNYFPNDDPSATPLNRWRAHGHLLYTNWLNYFVYQTTPFDISKTVREKNDEKEDSTHE